jgi:hypothetical protein
MMDEASVVALDCAARHLRLSRSDIIQRLAHLAGGAAFWGVQLLPVDSDPETLRRGAEAACEEWGLLTLGRRWRSDPPPLLRVIQGGADDPPGGEA